MTAHTHTPAPKRRRADMAIESDGLTVDTKHGPADLVAVERLLAGLPTPAALAGTTLAYALAKGGRTAADLPLRRPTPARQDITCHRCGQHYPITPARRPWRTPAYTCTPNCTIDTVDDTADLFRARMPGAWLWHLGSDDRDRPTPAQIADIDAQPRWTVTLYDNPAAAALLTTRPLPEQYAFAILAQAGRLGFTALPVQYPAVHATGTEEAAA